MEFRKVVAIVSRGALEPVETALRSAGVTGVSVCAIKGFGEYADFYERDWMTNHVKVEVFTVREKAGAIAHVIMAAAHTGQEGDGIVAISPVESLFRIRTQAAVEHEGA
jgi:nitrogen regulatory protein P-II 1